ncbi:MAG: TraB/GumN family protein [Euryarchaeota archaeon]|nr:TraB/GumN family protein [Euryarchaeota archaeon]
MNETPDQHAEIIVVGTAHISEESIAEVRRTIEEERPDVVAVELDPGRYQALTYPEQQSASVKDILSSGKLYQFLVHWLLAYVQNKLGAEVGVKPGSEMLSAIDAARSVGASVALVDRDINVTIARFWAKMRLIEKLKMLIALLGIGTSDEEIDLDLKEITSDDTISQLVTELRQFSPNAAQVLVDERDAYLAGNLLKLRGKIVAVVGAGHKEGIKHYLEHPELVPSLEDLNTVPKKRFNLTKIVGIAFLAIIIGLFALIFLSGAPLAVVLLAFGYWFVLHAVLAAGFAAACRSHPLAITASAGYAGFSPFIPIPFLKVGVIAGLIEAAKRPPNTEDFSGIAKVASVRELLSNKLFRILVVAVAVNVGSSLATFISLFVIFPMTGINPYDVLQTAFLRITGMV